MAFDPKIVFGLCTVLNRHSKNIDLKISLDESTQYQIEQWAKRMDLIYRDSSANLNLILKEPMIIFSFGLILNSLIPKRKWANISSFIVAILIIFKVKFYIFICVFPALISYIISEKTKLKPPRIIFTICVIMAVIIFALGKMNNNYNPLNILSQKQNDFITLSELFDTGSAYEITLIEPSINSLLKAIPKGAINGFFRPFPNDINNLFREFNKVQTNYCSNLVASARYFRQRTH